MAGIIDTIKLAGTLVLAIPAALAGLDFLLVGGQPFYGAALLVFAAALVISQHYLTLPGDIPGLLAKRAASSVVNGGESAGDADAETDAERVEAVQHDSDTK